MPYITSPLRNTTGHFFDSIEIAQNNVMLKGQFAHKTNKRTRGSACLIGQAEVYELVVLAVRDREHRLLDHVRRVRTRRTRRERIGRGLVTQEVRLNEHSRTA